MKGFVPDLHTATRLAVAMLLLMTVALAPPSQADPSDGTCGDGLPAGQTVCNLVLGCQAPVCETATKFVEQCRDNLGAPLMNPGSRAAVDPSCGEWSKDCGNRIADAIEATAQSEAFAEITARLRESAFPVESYDVCKRAGLIPEMTTCQGPWLKEDLYEIIDQAGGQGGDFFTVTVLRSVLQGNIRVAFEAQIPRSEEGVNVYMTKYSDGVPTYANPYVANSALRGGCGVMMGSVQSEDDSFDLQVAFMGQDITITDSQGDRVMREVTAESEMEFKVNPANFASFRVGASETDTWEHSSGHTVSTTGYLKVFEQDYPGARTPLAELIQSVM